MEPPMPDRTADSAARLEESHALAHVWSRSVIDVTFDVGDRRVRLDTEIEAERGSDDIYTVHGTVGQGEFAFEMTRPLFDALAADLPGDVDLAALDATDAALVVEYVLSDALNALEGEIGSEVTVTEVVPGPLLSALEPIAVVIWVDKLRRSVRAVVDDLEHMRILREWLAPMEMGAEVDAGPATRVEVGPIELLLDDIDALEVGDAIAIGTEPGQNLKGRLVRPTGRTIPVTIDTAQVVVAGEGGTLDDTAGEGGTVGIGAQIGTVRLTPTNLRRAKIGSRFIMERNPDNACALYAGHEIVARGSLTLIDGQLGIEIVSIGSGPAPTPAGLSDVAPIDDGSTPPTNPAIPQRAPDDGLNDDEVDLASLDLDNLAVAPRATTRQGADAARVRVSGGAGVRVDRTKE